jgi:large subunit ribosomal protein L5
MPRLKDRFNSEIKPSLINRFSYKNVMQIPKIEKIVLNMGIGEGISNIKTIEAGVQQLTNIAGQKPVVCRAKKSISNFKLREGMPIGVKVTLRASKMYEFLDRLINIAMPEIRDFRGIKSGSFDGKGNFTFAIEEQIVFPEVDYDSVDKIRGLSITFVTTAKTDEEGKALLEEFGFPFVRS